MNIIKILKKLGAILTNDHFVYTSGKHGSVYINKDFLYLHPKETSLVAKMLAKKFKNYDVEMVVSPAIGGTILGSWTAYYLSILKKKEIIFAYTEKDKGQTSSGEESTQIFKRGYDKYVFGKKVLVIEDLTTTGISAKKTVEAVKKAGGKVVAVGVMVNRNPKKVNKELFGVDFYSLGILELEAYEKDKCPLCQKKVPINIVVGHGKKFLEGKK